MNVRYRTALLIQRALYEKHGTAPQSGRCDWKLPDAYVVLVAQRSAHSAVLCRTSRKEGQVPLGRRKI